MATLTGDPKVGFPLVGNRGTSRQSQWKGNPIGCAAHTLLGASFVLCRNSVSEGRINRRKELASNCV